MIEPWSRAKYDFVDKVMGISIKDWIFRSGFIIESSGIFNLAPQQFLVFFYLILILLYSAGFNIWCILITIYLGILFTPF